MKKNMLENGSVVGVFFRLALPAVVAQVVNMLYNMVDRMYIGHAMQNYVSFVADIVYDLTRSSIRCKPKIIKGMLE